MKSFLALAVMAVAITFCSSAASAAEPAADVNTTCPIMQKEAVKSDIYVDYKGERVFLCCMKCKNRFSKDPDKYLERVHAQKAALAVSKKGQKAGQ